MRLFDICVKREYEQKGEKKAKWYKVGTLKASDSGVQYIRFFHQPMTDFFVFENKPSETKLPVIE